MAYLLVFAEITDHQNKFLWYRYLLEKLPLVNYSTLKCIVTHIWKWVSFFHIHLYLIFHLKILGAVIKWENGTHEYYWIKLNIFFLKSASINFHTQVWPDILYQVWPLLHFIWLKSLKWLTLCYRMSLMEAANKMSVEALVTCFAPTLMRTEHDVVS